MKEKHLSKQPQIVHVYMLPPPIPSTMPYSYSVHVYGMRSYSLSAVPSAPHPSHLV